jgi:hypothetical protein
LLGTNLIARLNNNKNSIRQHSATMDRLVSRAQSRNGALQESQDPEVATANENKNDIQSEGDNKPGSKNRQQRQR